VAPSIRMQRNSRRKSRSDSTALFKCRLWLREAQQNDARKQEHNSTYRPPENRDRQR
jgi:hypothetical protein